MSIFPSTPHPLQLQFTFPSGSQAMGLSINVEISFTPNFEVPASGSISRSPSALLRTPTCRPALSSHKPIITACSDMFLQQLCRTDSTLRRLCGNLREIRSINFIFCENHVFAISDTEWDFLFDFSRYAAQNFKIETGTAAGSLVASASVPAVAVAHAVINTPTIIFLQVSLGKYLPASIPGFPLQT